MISSKSKTYTLVVILAFLPLTLTFLGGCHSIDFYDQSLEQPVSPACEPPRELSMMALPRYRIAPPDVLELELVKMVPLPPYRIESYDVLEINVAGTLMDQPIAGYKLIEAEGTVNLGPTYGTVRVIGMTIPEATKAIDNHLRQVLREPEVSVQLARASGLQQVTGQYLVAPDGTINLRQYGRVHVAGKTVVEAKLMLEKQLSQYLDSPEVSVNVSAFNSKAYYVVTEGAGLGDNVVRIPVTGNETVLDAISQIRGLSKLSRNEIWIARPTPGGSGCEQILPIDWVAITKGGDASTNYQIFPGDRVFIAQDDMIALSSFISKVIGPAERLFGFTSLGVATIRNIKSIPTPTF